MLLKTQAGNPILRKKARALSVSKIKTDEIQNLIKQMFFTLRKSHGVGLAAPQINQSLRLAVMEVKASKKNKKIKALKKTAVINPRILELSKETASDWEGCLSIKGIWAKVPRSTSVTVEYYNELAEKITETHTGLHAVIFQHEIDHLEGILFIDRVQDTKTIITESEYRNRILKKKKTKKV
jgi:peptide deformylase